MGFLKLQQDNDSHNISCQQRIHQAAFAQLVLAAQQLLSALIQQRCSRRVYATYRKSTWFQICHNTRLHGTFQKAIPSTSRNLPEASLFTGAVNCSSAQPGCSPLIENQSTHTCSRARARSRGVVVAQPQATRHVFLEMSIKSTERRLTGMSCATVFHYSRLLINKINSSIVSAVNENLSQLAIHIF